MGQTVRKGQRTLGWREHRTTQIGQGTMVVETGTDAPTGAAPTFSLSITKTAFEFLYNQLL